MMCILQPLGEIVSEASVLVGRAAESCGGLCICNLSREEGAAREGKR